MNFPISVDHRVKIKKSEKRDKYFDHARKLNKLWKMRMTVLPIVISALGTIHKVLVDGVEELEIRGREKTI